jgi:tetratricopeptide (TPR) repeat protein
MRVSLTTLILAAVSAAQSAAQPSEMEAGRACYTAGEFKKAASHFQLAVNAHPSDAEPYYWLGMSYQRMADIAFPFGGAGRQRARICLTRAVELAPGRADYRTELFEFLLDPTAWSRRAFRQAAQILQATPESDPAYADMLRRLQAESKANASASARLGRLVLLVPQTACLIAKPM